MTGTVLVAVLPVSRKTFVYCSRETHRRKENFFLRFLYHSLDAKNNVDLGRSL